MNLIALLCEEANNTEIITVIVNACVSVISVLLGFGLSKFTERTSCAIELKFLKFSKNELQAIEKFLKVFNNIFDIVTKTNRYCENVFDVNLITEATNLLDDITNTSLQGLTNK